VAEDRLGQLITRLEDAAASLRSGELDGEHAAALVDECARLAAEAATELDREVRAADAPDSSPGQLQLDG
jgi:hypothetical protein